MDTLIVQTTQHLKIYAGPDLVSPYVIDGNRLTLGFTPWPSQPVMLCSDDFFCGLSYHVAIEYLDAVMGWVTKVGSDRVRLIKTSEYDYYAEHRQQFNSEYFLELIWTQDTPDRVIFAALSEDGWLYLQDKRGDVDTFDAVFGIMLVAVSDIADEFGLKLPEHLSTCEV